MFYLLAGSADYVSCGSQPEQVYADTTVSI